MYKLLVIIICCFIVWYIWRIRQITVFVDEHQNCLNELKTVVKSYKQLFKILNGREITDEEWNDLKNSLGVKQILNDLNIQGK